MQPPPVYRLIQVSKRFGYRQVLQDLSLEIDPGDTVLALGENGAGKSTLLRLLSTLLRPSSGEIQFRGRPIAESGAAVRREVGMISHDPRLYGDLTARENLKVFGTLYGAPHLDQAIAAGLERVALADVPDVPVRAFSSGMLKRLALARLLLYRPTVLLLDEPYAGLDQASLGVLDGLLDEFRLQGCTLVLVTHQFTPGIALCNRALVLQQGRLVYNQRVHQLDAAACAALLRRLPGPPASMAGD